MRVACGPTAHLHLLIYALHLIIPLLHAAPMMTNEKIHEAINDFLIPVQQMVYPKDTGSDYADGIVGPPKVPKDYIEEGWDPDVDFVKSGKDKTMYGRPSSAEFVSTETGSKFIKGFKTPLDKGSTETAYGGVGNIIPSLDYFDNIQKKRRKRNAPIKKEFNNKQVTKKKLAKVFDFKAYPHRSAKRRNKRDVHVKKEKKVTAGKKVQMKESPEPFVFKDVYMPLKEKKRNKRRAHLTIEKEVTVNDDYKIEEFDDIISDRVSDRNAKDDDISNANKDGLKSDNAVNEYYSSDESFSDELATGALEIEKNGKQDYAYHEEEFVGTMTANPVLEEKNDEEKMNDIDEYQEVSGSAVMEGAVEESESNDKSKAKLGKYVITRVDKSKDKADVGDLKSDKIKMDDNIYEEYSSEESLFDEEKFDDTMSASPVLEEKNGKEKMHDIKEFDEPMSGNAVMKQTKDKSKAKMAEFVIPEAVKPGGFFYELTEKLLNPEATKELREKIKGPFEAHEFKLKKGKAENDMIIESEAVKVEIPSKHSKPVVDILSKSVKEVLTQSENYSQPKSGDETNDRQSKSEDDTRPRRQFSAVMKAISEMADKAKNDEKIRFEIADLLKSIFGQNDEQINEALGVIFKNGIKSVAKLLFNLEDKKLNM